MIWGFKNTSGDEVFLLDSSFVERHGSCLKCAFFCMKTIAVLSRSSCWLRGRDAGCWNRSHSHNHGLWKHGKSGSRKGLFEQILISCKSLRSVAVRFCGYTKWVHKEIIHAFSQNHHLQANKNRQRKTIQVFFLFVMYCFHKFGGFSWIYDPGKHFPSSTRQRCASISSPFWGPKNLGGGRKIGLGSSVRWWFSFLWSLMRPDV